MSIATVLSDTKVPVKIWTKDIEEAALQQLRNTANMPFVFKHVAAMPDVHFGMGATIGSVIATRGAVMPSAVGVDIGCGMSAVQLPFDAEALGSPTRLAELRHSLERSVPTGKNGNAHVTERAALAFTLLGQPIAVDMNNRVIKNARLQLGSLGGGNHFIEICVEPANGRAWLLLHSGSRNIGKHLADIHIGRAKGIMKDYFINLPDPDLAYFVQGTEAYKDYFHDLMWAQNFAKWNRHEMKLRVIKDLSFHVYGNPDTLTKNLPGLVQIDCHHNYSSMEHHFGANVLVTRKGAVSAKPGELGIIPGSMGTRSYIVQGKGNPESFHSCAHGAGRRMSRTKARATFTEKDLADQTAGVECRKDAVVIDEIPAAYKDVDQVMENQSDLVEVLHIVKQIICVKGG